MVDFLFGTGQEVPLQFVLSQVGNLYVLPRPYPYSKPRLSMQKSVCALIRLCSVAVVHHDCATCRCKDEEDDQVFRSSAFAFGLIASDFAELPPSVKESLSSLGVQTLLLPTLRHFGFGCMDRQHSFQPRLYSTTNGNGLGKGFARTWPGCA